MGVHARWDFGTELVGKRGGLALDPCSFVGVFDSSDVTMMMGVHMSGDI